MRFYSLFDLPIDFNIDLEQLNSRYRDIQKQIHPDNYANASDSEKLLAIQTAAEINDAFQTLKSPLLRAEYMVAEQGVDVRQEQHTINDNLFLMQQIELREALEEIEQAIDVESALDDFSSEIKVLTKQYLKDFEQHYTQQNYPEAADSVRKLKFFYKLKEQADIIEDKLFD